MINYMNSKELKADLYKHFKDFCESQIDLLGSDNFGELVEKMFSKSLKTNYEPDNIAGWKYMIENECQRLKTRRGIKGSALDNYLKRHKLENLADAIKEKK